MTLNYQQIIQEALLGVVHSVLQDTVDNGLEDPHHFYITFRTTYPGVELPPFLKERYPDEMTIVLQYQFQNLTVDSEKFSVELSFNGQFWRLTIPFKALETFADPSEQFALQFMPSLIEENEPAQEAKAPAEVIDLASLRAKK